MADQTAPSQPGPPQPELGQSEAGQRELAAPPKRRRHPRRAGRRGVGLGTLSWVLAAIASVALAALLLNGGTIHFPVWTVATIEDRVNRNRAADDGAVSISGIALAFEPGAAPRLMLTDLRLLQAGGQAFLVLPEVRLGFDAAAMVRGRLAVESVRLVGGRIAVARDAAGLIDIDFGGGARAARPESIAALVQSANRLLAQRGFRALERIEAEALTLTLRDARAGRTWEVGDGRLTFENRDEDFALEVSLSLVGGATLPGQAVVTLVAGKTDGSARITATVDRLAATDLAAQAEPLAWLGILDAPISGRIAASLDEDGAVATFEGTLELGPGALQPLAESLPVAFERAGVNFDYDSVRRRIAFRDVTVESGTLRLAASGHSDLVAADEADAVGNPPDFVTQLAFSDVRIDPEGLFEAPVRFSGGALDLRLRLAPFALDIGQLALTEAGRSLRLSGRMGAGTDGWRLALDVGMDRVGRDRLLALWPVTLVPGTRNWATQNVQRGELVNLRAALRVAPGGPPRVTVGYEFSDADVRILRTLPPITGAQGYSTVEGTVHTMVLDRGRITAPEGGQIDMAGSVFTVPDITARPTRADITMRTRSSLTAALSLLDQPPFRFMTKANRPVDVGTGTAEIVTRLQMPLVPRIQVSDVSYDVAGTVRDLRSDVLVPGHALTAEALALTADQTGLRLSGKGRLGEVAFDAVYALGFGKAAGGRAQVDGTVILSDAVVREFKLGLPDGTIRGEAPARVSLALAPGTPTRLTVQSDLAGATLALPQLGWTKPAAARGRLEAEVTLGPRPEVERLALSAAGLEASGRITFRDNGTLDVARFARVRLNGWLDVAADLTGRGRGRAVGIAVTGGRVDLRGATFGGGGGPGGGAGGSAIEASLDRVDVSEGIALTGFRGSFTPQGGTSGQFTARINGAAPVSGTVVPSPNGTAVRVLSEDAGATLAAAGIFPDMRGGTLDLMLTPRGPKGDYDGTARLADFRVRNTSILAELLNAISVVGLLEQLAGGGILFSGAEAEFRLTPRAVEISRASAIGASMGLSAAGVYLTENRRLDVQGVVSPVYLLNGIGAVLTRRGEGLFGFNYRLTGAANAPDVAVNPLSILTPGMFRDLFREPPPVLRDGGVARDLPPDRTGPAPRRTPRAVREPGGDR